MRSRAASRSNRGSRSGPASRLLAGRVISVLIGGALMLLVIGCGERFSSDDVLARAGRRVLTRKDFKALTGRSADSLSAADCWRVVEAWIERALLEEEGKRRDLDDDSQIKAKLAAVRAELFRAKLLAELPASPPTDSVVQMYYELHKTEFLRPRDTYLIELYWGEDRAMMARFRDQLQHGDTTQLATGEVTAEGAWLAESGELDTDLVRELASLKPSGVTFPRVYENGYRVVRLRETYTAGTVLDRSVVRDEIMERLILEQGRKRQDSLLAALRMRHRVEIFLRDSL